MGGCQCGVRVSVCVCQWCQCRGVSVEVRMAV